MLEWLGMPVAASAHAGRSGSDHGAGPLADAGAVRRLGPLLRLRAGPLPRGRNPGASITGSAAAGATWVEGGVLVAEIVLLAFFSIPFWSTSVDALPPERQSTVVRVVAEQFAWNVHYPGADGSVRPHAPSRWSTPTIRSASIAATRRRKDDITTINQLNLPVGQAGDRLPVQQGRGAQLRDAADAREAGRDARASSSRSGSRRRRPAAGTSPARSCAAWRTTG